MKSKKRIVFTLLYNSGNFALSRNFRLQNIGDYDWLQENYNFSNISFHIDELIILDVTRGEKNKVKFSQLVKNLSENIFVPLTVGGGIERVEDAKLFFDSGADKVSINKSLFNNSDLAKEISSVYGQQCLIASLDVIKKDNVYFIKTNNGDNFVGELTEFLHREKVSINVGEFYINSINQDGTGNGLDLKLAELIYHNAEIPFIIAGGIGKIKDISDSLKCDYINAVSTAHLLNFIGDALERTRIVCNENQIKLAKWLDLKEIL